MRAFLTVALLTVIVTVCPAQVSSGGPSNALASLILDTAYNENIPVGSTVSAVMSVSGMAPGSAWELHVSLGTQSSHLYVAGIQVPFQLASSVAIDYGTLTGPALLASSVYVPFIPQLVGRTPYFQLVASDGLDFAVSNMVMGGPIIQDILH